CESDLLLICTLRAPASTLFPYTTLFRSAGGQTLRAVRRERANLPLLRIEPECDEALVVHPEVAIESLLQLARTPPQLEPARAVRSEEHTSELQSRENIVCRLLLEKKKTK